MEYNIGRLPSVINNGGWQFAGGDVPTDYQDPDATMALLLDGDKDEYAVYIPQDSSLIIEIDLQRYFKVNEIRYYTDEDDDSRIFMQVGGVSSFYDIIWSDIEVEDLGLVGYQGYKGVVDRATKWIRIAHYCVDKTVQTRAFEIEIIGFTNIVEFDCVTATKLLPDRNNRGDVRLSTAAVSSLCGEQDWVINFITNDGYEIIGSDFGIIGYGNRHISFYDIDSRIEISYENWSGTPQPGDKIRFSTEYKQNVDEISLCSAFVGQIGMPQKVRIVNDSSMIANAYIEIVSDAYSDSDQLVEISINYKWLVGPYYFTDSDYTIDAFTKSPNIEEDLLKMICIRSGGRLYFPRTNYKGIEFRATQYGVTYNDMLIVIRRHPINNEYIIYLYGPNGTIDRLYNRKNDDSPIVIVNDLYEVLISGGKYVPDYWPVRLRDYGAERYLAQVNTADADISFTSEAYGGVQPYAYFWRFGDGSTSSTQNPSHEYTSTGAYDVSCLVVDTRSIKFDIEFEVNIYEDYYATPIQCNISTKAP